MVKLNVEYNNLNDKLEVVDTSNSHSKRVLGTLEGSLGQSYTFKPNTLVFGCMALPVRLTEEEQEEVCWLQYKAKEFL